MRSLVAQLETAFSPALPAASSTLAQFVAALGVGSLCFCCGSSLAPSTHGRKGVILACSRCGAEVATDQVPALQQAA